MPTLSRATLGVALALLCAAAPASAQVAPPDPERPPLDVREQGPDPAPLPATRAEIRGREELSDRLGDQGVLDFEPATNSARIVAKLDGFLTGPSGADPADIALGFVRANPATFGLSAGEIDDLELVRRYTDNGGTTHLVWAQTLDGIVAWGNELLANVAKDGRLINVSGSPVDELTTRTTKPELTRRQAIARALDDAGRRGTGGHEAELVLFTERPGDTHIAWQVTANVDDDEIYEYVIDARDGRLLFRRNTVDNVAAQISAWENAPDIHISLGGGLPNAAGEQQLKTTLFGGDAIQVNDGTALNGPYAHVYPDLDDNNEVDSGVPASGGTTWNYPLQRFVGGGTCPPAVPTTAGQFTCVWTGGAAPSVANNANVRQNAAQVYYYVNNFHDWLAKEPNIGFTAASGNFETAGGDAVQAEIYDGSSILDADHRNNANMSTPPDGTPPRMQMYLFRGGGGRPHANGGDDASVIYHEYGHGLSNRLVTGGTRGSTLNTHQSDSMGEGWSDWYAMDYLESQGFEVTDTVGDQGQLILGRYIFANDPNGLRAEPLDCPVDPTPEAECSGTAGSGPGGYTYGDLGQIQGGPEVHDDGEIWAQTLWDLRQQIGPAAARRVITDGMRLSAPRPSFLDMRNAIIQADRVAFGGANRATIWSVFAARGMGASASSTSGNDTSPVEAFDVPGPGVTASGRVTDAATGAGIANAYVHFDAGAAPGDFATRTDGNGNYSLGDVPPATFARVLVAAPGFAHGDRSNVTAGGGIDFALPRNFAAAASGGKISTFTGVDFTADGCGPGGLIDGALGTGWGSTSHNAPQAGGAKTAVIELPQAIDVTGIAIDPNAVCGDGPSASTRLFRLEVSPDGQTFTEFGTGTFTPADLGRLNTMSRAAAGVRFVRYTMIEPLTQSGPDDGPTGVSGVLFMDTSEIEVYGAPPQARVQPPPPPPPGGGPGPDVTAPRPSMAVVSRQKLRTAVARGLKLRISCNEACSVKMTATIDAKTAKRLKLLRRNSRARTFKVGAGSLRLGTGSRSATVKFTRKSKPKLRRLRSFKLSVTATVRDAAGNSRRTTKKVTLRR